MGVCSLPSVHLPLRIRTSESLDFDRGETGKIDNTTDALPAGAVDAEDSKLLPEISLPSVTTWILRAFHLFHKPVLDHLLHPNAVTGSGCSALSVEVEPTWDAVSFEHRSPAAIPRLVPAASVSSSSSVELLHTLYTDRLCFGPATRSRCTDSCMRCCRFSPHFESPTPHSQNRLALRGKPIPPRSLVAH